MERRLLLLAFLLGCTKAAPVVADAGVPPSIHPEPAPAPQRRSEIPAFRDILAYDTQSMSLLARHLRRVQALGVHLETTVPAPGVGIIRFDDLGRTAASFIKTRLLVPDVERFDTDGSLARVAYFGHVTHCLPRDLPAIGRHDGYYSDEVCRSDPTLALLVHGIDRTPANVKAVWAATRDAAFAAVSGADYTAKLRKTVEALRTSLSLIRKAPGWEDRLQASFRNLEALHADPARRDSVYGWRWAEAMDEDLVKRVDEASTDARAVDGRWLVSFWMRRHHEGCLEVVSGILDEIAGHYGP